MHSGKTGNLFSYYYWAVYEEFGLQIVFICLYITPSHYHHCANLAEDIELKKCLSDIFCRACKTDHVLSVIRYTIYGIVCLHFTHLPCDDWDNICFVLLSSSNRKYEFYPLFRVRSWNNGIRCMSLNSYDNSTARVVHFNIKLNSMPRDYMTCKIFGKQFLMNFEFVSIRT